jgi:ornithine decarboxylase
MRRLARLASMDGLAGTFSSTESLLSAHRPIDPVYCIYPDAYVDNARAFVDRFPGRVLYAVKANDHPDVIRLLVQGGVTHFDCASLPEIELVHSLVDAPTCYFMTPVRLRDAARVAREQYGVRHFMIDHASGIDLLRDEIDIASCVVFARMAVSHDSAMIDLSNRFGAPPADMPRLLEAIAATGAEPALAFNVGSGVTDPAAYLQSMAIARTVLEQIPFRIRLLDIGGGFPRSYPGFEVPPLQAYFDAIKKDAATLPLAEGSELLAEPGRALAAPGLSAIVEVRLRKEDRLFLNDGMYGIFWELRFKGHDRYPVRAYREGKLLDGAPGRFRLFGPTCDSFDEMPGDVELPADVRPGDYLEFGGIGAYSLAGRTRFNGFYSDQIVTITGGRPPD